MSSLFTNNNWIYAGSVLLLSVLLLMNLALYLMRRRMEAYDRHIEECGTRAATTARMDQRLMSMEMEVLHLRKMNHWIGTCITVIGAKLDVDLPERPF